MVMKLYGPRQSGSTARVIVCLEEKGINYELVHIDMASGEHKQPAHIKRNPFGQVPVLQDDDLIIFDSRAISRYIAHKYKDIGPDLLRESNIKEFGRVNQWIEVETTQLHPLVSPLIYHCLIMPVIGLTPDQFVIASNVEKLDKVLDVYERQLGKTKYLAGDNFSLADLNHLASIHYLLKTPYASLIESRANLKAWWVEMASRLRKFSLHLIDLPSKL